jgi:hypothetical protein
MRAADSRTFWTAGNNSPMRIAMMAITTSNSISVKPRRIAATFRHMTTLLKVGQGKRLESNNRLDGKLISTQRLARHESQGYSEQGDKGGREIFNDFSRELSELRRDGAKGRCFLGVVPKITGFRVSERIQAHHRKCRDNTPPCNVLGEERMSGHTGC